MRMVCLQHAVVPPVNTLQHVKMAPLLTSTPAPVPPGTRARIVMQSQVRRMEITRIHGFLSMQYEFYQMRAINCFTGCRQTEGNSYVRGCGKMHFDRKQSIIFLLKLSMLYLEKLFTSISFTSTELNEFPQYFTILIHFYLRPNFLKKLTKMYIKKLSKIAFLSSSVIVYGLLFHH